MSEKKPTGVEDFLKLEECQSLKDFDFKNLMVEYYEYYSKNHSDDEYKKLLNELPKMKTEDNIEKWYCYKTLDRNIDKRIRRFDCDSWNDTCELASQIYDCLWRKVPTMPKAVRCLSPDTMNSFATFFNQLTGKSSFEESYLAYQKKEADITNDMAMYAQNVGCIGNFVLVPKGYNVYRARQFRDNWGQSLCNILCNEDSKNWLPDGLSPTQYINLFFLWDYVEQKDGKYAVKSDFCEGESLQKLIPRLNKAISRRGEFMVKILRTAKDHPECYAQVITGLTNEELYLQDTKSAEKWLEQCHSIY